MNSPDHGAQHQNKEPNGCLQSVIFFSLPFCVLVIIAALVVPGCRREKAREAAEKKAREVKLQQLMDAARIKNQMRENLELGASIHYEKPTGGTEAGRQATQGISAASEALKELIPAGQVVDFFRTWEIELGKGSEGQKIYAQCSKQAEANRRSRHFSQRDLAASIIILIDQSLRTGKEVDATALASEVFGQGLQPPEIMILAALKALASLETGFSGVTSESADEEFAKISKSLAVWESALKIASEGSYSRFNSEEGEAFYQKQFESYRAQLHHYNAAVSKFKESGQMSDMIEAKSAAEGVLRVLANPLLTWRASDDRKIQAKFIKLEGEALVIEKEDGVQYTVPFGKLAPTSIEMGKRLEYVVSSVPTVRVHSS